MTGSTAALQRAALLAAALVVAGVALGRADLVAVAGPFVLAAAAGLARRPPSVRARLDAVRDEAEEAGTVELVVRVSTDATVGAVAVVELPTALPRVVVVAAGTPTVLTVPVLAQRWGRRRLGPARVVAADPQLVRQAPPVRSGDAVVRVWPRRQGVAATGAALSARLRVGTHRTRVAGPGVEPLAVRPYALGDRVRQVDWRATSRTGELHVRATTTDRAADLVVVLDALSDPGPPGGTSLDTAVRAAAALVEHYLTAGDTVELVQYGGRLRTLPAGSGRAHLVRAREWLLDVALPLNDAVAESTAPWLPGPVSARSLVVVLSPLLDEQTSRLLAQLRQRGATVVVLDVLPPSAVPDVPSSSPGPATHLARRLWLLEREALRSRLSGIGVPVVPWTETGSLDAVLAPLVRSAGAPRVRPR